MYKHLILYEKMEQRMKALAVTSVESSIGGGSPSFTAVQWQDQLD